MTIEHAVILDAGSSGTRIFIYRWKRWNEGDPAPPAIEQVYIWKKDGGGIQELARHSGSGPAPDPILIEGRVSQYLEVIFDKARIFLGPGVTLRSVPLFLLGTAGMRDFGKEHGARYKYLLKGITSSCKKSGFLWKESGEITGENEAIYGWVAANYLLGTFSGYGINLDSTVGYLEMGGASAQIAFRPMGLGANHDPNLILTKVRVGSTRFYLYVKSYPLGADKAWAKHEERVNSKSANDDGEKEDPCRPRRWRSGNSDKVVGTGKYEECMQETKEILKELWKGELDEDDTRRDVESFRKGFLFTKYANDSSLYTALQGRRFVGGAHFWYTTREIFGLDREGQPKKTPYTYEEFYNEVSQTYKRSWGALQKRTPGVKMHHLTRAWFSAAWINNILRFGFGFPGIAIGDTQGQRQAQNTVKAKITQQAEVSEAKPIGPTINVVRDSRLSFQPYNGADGAELSWTLGRIVLYATGNYTPEELKVSTIKAARVNRERLKKEAAETDKAAELAREEVNEDEANVDDIKFEIRATQHPGNQVEMKEKLRLAEEQLKEHIKDRDEKEILANLARKALEDDV